MEYKIVLLGFIHKYFNQLGLVWSMCEIDNSFHEIDSIWSRIH